MLAKGFYMVKTITLDNYKETILSNNIIFLLYFWSFHSGACRIVSPVVERLNDEYNNKIIIGKIDVDVEANLAEQFNVKSTPTVFILKDMKIVNKAVGAKPIAFYRNMIKKASEIR